MARDVLNYLGEKIGELDLPEGTDESVWEAKLALYARAPESAIASVTARQLRLELLERGITNTSVLDAIDTYIPEPDKSKAIIEWRYGMVYDRYSPFTNGVGALLGLSDSDVDDIWIKAASR